MKIADIKLKNNLIAAPIAGVTDLPFRLLCRKYGAALCYSEMINANALVRKNKATIRLMKTCNEDSPLGIQLFGTKLDVIKEAAKIVEKAGADMIDFNFGCPAPEIIRQGAGSALMKRPQKVYDIIKMIKDNVSIPVTAKIRAGFEKVNAVEIARLIEEAGADAVTIHGRTQKQGYGGKVDHDIIQKVKDSVSIPVIGNGDIFDIESYKKMENITGLVMIGRAMMGWPQFFEYLLTCEKQTQKQRIDDFLEYYRLSQEYDTLHKARLSEQAMQFTRHMPGAKRLRDAISRSEDIMGFVRNMGL